MKCKNCGANAFFQDNFIVCENCGNYYPMDSTFENVEVFICYVENDDNGRRTKDSIIAQDIYNRLENTKINTFYERVSAGNLIEDDLEKACYSAIYHAKIVLIVGTEQKHFEGLIQRYRDVTKDKKIIPVCSDMNLSILPEEIKKLQALNYDAVGASSDLFKSVLILLGRQSEIDTKNKRKKRTIIIIVICCILIIGLFLGGLFIFYEKEPEEPIQTEEVVDSRPTDYKLAQKYIEQEKYADAIEILHKLGDYENSKNVLALVYEKYEGYYWDEASGISLHLNISDNRKASVEISCSINGVVVRITESGEIEVNKIELEYIDSENSSGNLILSMKNESVNLYLKPDEITDLSIGTKEIRFLITDKSDKPYAKSVDANTLRGWLDNKTTIDDISRMGFEVESNGVMFSESRGMQAYSYKIKNTDVELLVSEAALWNEEIKSEEKIIFAISAPASIILPDRIGKQSYPFVSKGYMYAPHGEFVSDPSTFFSLGVCSDYPSPDAWLSGQKIEAGTCVNFVSKKSMGQYNWEELLETTIGSYLGMKQIENDEKNCNDGKVYKSRSYTVIAQSNQNFLIVIAREILDGNLTLPATAAYYKINKESYNAELIFEYELPKNGRQSYIHWDIWKRYPDIFAEFINADE